MLINLSNHPLSQWSERQREAAHAQFGKVRDIPFPAIDPYATEQEIQNLAKDYFTQIEKMHQHERVKAVHLMGEFSFSFALVDLLKKSGFRVVVSTSERNVTVLENGEKQVKFNFVKFRNY